MLLLLLSLIILILLLLLLLFLSYLLLFQVARHVANASSISFNQTSPAAIAVYSHVRHQPTPSTPDSQNSNIIHSARNEILRTIELMIEKNQHEVVHLIVEVFYAGFLFFVHKFIIPE